MLSFTNDSFEDNALAAKAVYHLERSGGFHTCLHMPFCPSFIFFAHASHFFLLVSESHSFFLVFLALILSSLRRLLTVLAEMVTS